MIFAPEKPGRRGRGGGAVESAVTYYLSYVKLGGYAVFP